MHCRGVGFLFAWLFASIQFVAGDANAAALGWKAGWTPAPSTKTDLLAAEALRKLKAYYAGNHMPGNCTLENAAVRKEWYVR
jgi:hypothetical protein